MKKSRVFVAFCLFAALFSVGAEKAYADTCDSVKVFVGPRTGQTYHVFRCLQADGRRHVWAARPGTGELVLDVYDAGQAWMDVFYNQSQGKIYSCADAGYTQMTTVFTVSLTAPLGWNTIIENRKMGDGGAGPQTSSFWINTVYVTPTMYISASTSPPASSHACAQVWLK